MRKLLIECTAIFLLHGGGSQALAGFVIYADRSSFEAGAAGLKKIDFEGIAPDGGFTPPYAAPPGLTISGVQFTIDRSNNDGYMWVIGKGYNYPDHSALTSQQSSSGPNNLVITLPGSGATAVGLDLGSFFGETVTFAFPTGDSFTMTPAALPDLGFIGFTSTFPFTSFTFEAPNTDVLNISSFEYGAASASAVPEPSGLALLGIGASLLLGRGWRRKRYETTTPRLLSTCARSGKKLAIS